MAQPHSDAGRPSSVALSYGGSCRDGRAWRPGRRTTSGSNAGRPGRRSCEARSAGESGNTDRSRGRFCLPRSSVPSIHRPTSKPRPLLHRRHRPVIRRGRAEMGSASNWARAAPSRHHARSTPPATAPIWRRVMPSSNGGASAGGWRHRTGSSSGGSPGRRNSSRCGSRSPAPRCQSSRAWFNQTCHSRCGAGSPYHVARSRRSATCSRGLAPPCARVRRARTALPSPSLPGGSRAPSRLRRRDTSTRGRRERDSSAHTLSRHHEAIAHELRAARPAPRPQGQTSPSGPWRPEAEAHGLPPQRRRTRSLEARAGPVAARLPCCLSGRSGTFAPATLPRPAIRSRS